MSPPFNNEIDLNENSISKLYDYSSMYTVLFEYGCCTYYVIVYMTFCTGSS